MDNMQGCTSDYTLAWQYGPVLRNDHEPIRCFNKTV